MAWQYPMKNMYLEEEVVATYPNSDPDFEDLEDQIEHVIDQELRKKVIQTSCFRNDVKSKRNGMHKDYS